MEHGESWWNVGWMLPGYQRFLEYLQQANGSKYSLLGNEMVAHHVFSAALVLVVLTLVAIVSRSQLRAIEKPEIPSDKVNLYNILELALGGIYEMSRSIIGKDAARYFPVLGTLTLFVFFSNILGLIPGFVPPTDNWNTTMAAGFLVFVYYHYHGLRVQGWKHIEHLANPAGTWWGWFLAPLMLPIELFSHCFRPITLGVRLAANMVADHAVLGAMIALGLLVIPLPFFVLGLLVCTIQTMVFVLLSMVYIGMSVEEHEHDDHHHEVEDGAHLQVQPAV